MTRLTLLLFAIFLFFISSHAQIPDLTKIRNIPDKVKVLDKYIANCLLNEEFDEAKAASLLELRLSNQTAIDSLITKSIFNVGASYNRLSIFDSAIYYFNQLYKPSVKIQPRLSIKTQLYLASSYQNLGQVDSVSSIMKRLETNTLLLKDSLSAENMKYLMFRGILTEDKGNFEKALQDYMKSLQISHIINDSIAITDNLGNIGAFYFNLDNYQKCLEYFEMALTYFKHSGNPKSLKACTFYRTMGIAYERIGKKELGLKYAQNSIKIAKKIKMTKLMVFCYTGIATIHLETKDYQNAEYYYLQALELLKNTKLKFNLLIVYAQLGSVSFEQKKYNVAKSYFEKARKIALEVGRKASISVLYKQLAKTEAALGNFRQAYKYIDIYAAYMDTINTETSSKNIAEMETKYQTENKKHQIVILNTKNKTQSLQLKNQRLIVYSLLTGTILILVIAGLMYRSYRTKQKINNELNEKNEELNTLIETVSENNEELTVLNEKLNEANDSKTKLFSIISHDLRSPVVSLFQFMKMQERDFSQLDEFSKQKYNETILQSAENLSDVMEDLLIWSKSQMEHFELSLETVNVYNLLTEIIAIHKIPVLQKQISVQLECSRDITIITDVNFFRVILRNLVSNAIKYSPNGEEVLISSHFVSDTLVVSIKNMGIGITKEQVSSLLNWGNIKSSTTGIGLKLTQEFVEKLHGTLEILSEPEDTTEFLLKLKPIGKSV